MGDEGFDELIHAPLRLRICSMLAPLDAVSFAVVRDSLGITDAHLSKQVKILSDAGYLTSVKGPEPGRTDSRKTTWLSLTPAGRKAFEAHVAELRRLLESATDPAPAPDQAAARRARPAAPAVGWTPHPGTA